MEELFEDAQLFIDSELSRTEEYNRCFSANLALEEAMKTQFGPEAHKLLMEFLDSYSEIERFNCLYYFYQGCLTAKQELEGQKSPDAKASGLFCFQITASCTSKAPPRPRCGGRGAGGHSGPGRPPPQCPGPGPGRRIPGRPRGSPRRQ